MTEQAVYRFLIQIERPHERVDMERVRALLEPAGVQIDPAYGPICINPKLERYVVRGTASEEARATAERIPGVRFFRDSQITPAQA
jgi:hypothetical protein